MSEESIAGRTDTASLYRYMVLFLLLTNFDAQNNTATRLQGRLSSSLPENVDFVTQQSQPVIEKSQPNKRAPTLARTAGAEGLSMSTTGGDHMVLCWCSEVKSVPPEKEGQAAANPQTSTLGRLGDNRSTCPLFTAAGGPLLVPSSPCHHLRGSMANSLHRHRSGSASAAVVFTPDSRSLALALASVAASRAGSRRR